MLGEICSSVFQLFTISFMIKKLKIESTQTVNMYNNFVTIAIFISDELYFFEEKKPKTNDT